MTTVFLDAVFKPFFKIIHDMGQQLMIDQTNFLTHGFLQIIQRTGFVSVVAWQLFTHRRIALRLWTAPWRPMLKCRRKSRWVTETDSPLVTNMSYTNKRCSTGQVSIATEVANPEEKNAKPPPGLPIEYYPFKRCQVFVGHPVHHCWGMTEFFGLLLHQCLH